MAHAHTTQSNLPDPFSANRPLLHRLVLRGYVDPSWDALCLILALCALAWRLCFPLHLQVASDRSTISPSSTFLPPRRLPDGSSFGTSRPDFRFKPQRDLFRTEWWTVFSVREASSS